jgi:hypothetical protein
MNITDFLSQLRSHADKPVRFLLPDGGLIPAHFHITEVGHVLKRFIDCGGTRRTLETCLLQTWVHDDVDHRLVAGKLAMIFDKAGDVLPHHELPVEIEYEDGVVAQFPVEGAEIIDDRARFPLRLEAHGLPRAWDLPARRVLHDARSPTTKVVPSRPAARPARNAAEMNKLLSELLGTFTLVFAGTGAIVINDVSGGVIGHAGIALTFGLVVMAMIYTYGDVSGAHLNPAVTLGFAVAGRFAWKAVPGYVLAQIAGAMAASSVLRLLFPTHEKLGATLPSWLRDAKLRFGVHPHLPCSC